MEDNTPIYARGKVVGHVSGRTFRKTVHASKHQLRRPPAWALDLDSLRQAEVAGAVFVQLRDLDSGAVWKAAIPAIRKCGQEFDRGFGRQIYLALNHWTTTAPATGPIGPVPTPDAPRQLALNL